MSKFSIFSRKTNDLIIFESPYVNDDQARAVSLRLQHDGVKLSSFHQDLLNQSRLSEKQRAWFHYLTKTAAEELVTKNAQAQKQDNFRPGLNLIKVIEMFTTASSQIKHPVFRVSIHESWPALRLTLAGPSSKYPNTVNVVSGDKTTWYGRIHQDGRFEPREVPELVVAQLVMLADDPLSIARLYGYKTGNCCFCGRTLTHHFSLEAGYGPICAERFGLPHGFDLSTIDAD